MLNKINFNLGCVVYTETTDGIQATWLHDREGSVERGTGIGKRLTRFDPKRSFEGQFEITYYDIDGNPSPQLNLTISFDSGYYRLTWRINGEITDLGIGFKSDKKLLVSYREAI